MPVFSVRQIIPSAAASLAGMPDLLVDVVHDGASVGFLAPLAPATATAYWSGVYASLGDALLLWVAESDGVAVGSVQLAPSMKQNGRHRAEVQKLLVPRAWRSRGVAKRLLAETEAWARAHGRTLLVLDTSAYRRLGWQDIGGIPDYAAGTDGALRANRIFYKRL